MESQRQTSLMSLLLETRQNSFFPSPVRWRMLDFLRSMAFIISSWISGCCDSHLGVEGSEGKEKGQDIFRKMFVRKI